MHWLRWLKLFCLLVTGYSGKYEFWVERRDWNKSWRWTTWTMYKIYWDPNKRVKRSQRSNSRARDKKRNKVRKIFAKRIFELEKIKPIFFAVLLSKIMYYHNLFSVHTKILDCVSRNPEFFLLCHILFILVTDSLHLFCISFVNICNS